MTVKLTFYIIILKQLISDFSSKCSLFLMKFTQVFKKECMKIEYNVYSKYTIFKI